MNQRQLTCIGCPMGCQLTATLEGGVVTAVTGNTCKRGDSYARKECVAPARTVTGTVRCTGGAAAVVSVRTAGEVPKEKVFQVAHALNTALARLPITRRGCDYPRCVRHRRLCSGHQERKISILYIVNILLPVV